MADDFSHLDNFTLPPQITNEQVRDAASAVVEASYAANRPERFSRLAKESLQALKQRELEENDFNRNTPEDTAREFMGPIFNRRELVAAFQAALNAIIVPGNGEIEAKVSAQAALETFPI